MVAALCDGSVVIVLHGTALGHRGGLQGKGHACIVAGDTKNRLFYFWNVTDGNN